MGRYLFTHEIFDAIDRTKPGVGGELQLTDAIAILLTEQPVYGFVFDEGRFDIGKKLDYLRAKQEAGAEAFFTQPFFDLRLMEIYQGLLSDCCIYWGVSPVFNENSRSYWENKNNAVFPPDFRPTLEWNRAFARQALQFARDQGSNLYFMPIRTDIVAYLDGIL